jgi:hypothetical protein
MRLTETKTKEKEKISCCLIAGLFQNYFFILLTHIYCMSIKPLCDKCKKELSEFGGILLSPPDNENKVKKYHLCAKCYNEIAINLM